MVPLSSREKQRQKGLLIENGCLVCFALCVLVYFAVFLQGAVQCLIVVSKNHLSRNTFVLKPVGDLPRG